MIIFIFIGFLIGVICTIIYYKIIKSDGIIEVNVDEENLIFRMNHSEIFSKKKKIACFNIIYKNSRK